MEVSRNRYEDACSEYISRNCYEVGTRWGTDDSTRAREEIDIAALCEGHTVLCECKYRSEPAGKDTIDNPVRRSGWVKSTLPKILMVFSKSGYTSDAVDTAESEAVILRSSEDISHPQDDARS